MLVLGTVFGLVNLIQELDHIRFNYDATQVARFVLFSLPQRLTQLAPVIALLGTIVALASLDRSNELAIISCAGVAVKDHRLPVGQLRRQVHAHVEVVEFECGASVAIGFELAVEPLDAEYRRLVRAVGKWRAVGPNSAVLRSHS